MYTGYGWEQFHKVIYTLASNPSGIKKRLITAYVYHLSNIRKKELPEDIQDDFRKIHEELTKVKPSGHEGSVAASVNAMDDSKASEIAEKIVSMFIRLQEKQQSK